MTLVLKENNTAKIIATYETDIIPRVDETLVFDKFRLLYKVNEVAHDLQEKVVYLYVTEND
jgi:hypothetical protein